MHSLRASSTLPTRSKPTSVQALATLPTRQCSRNLICRAQGNEGPVDGGVTRRSALLFASSSAVLLGGGAGRTLAEPVLEVPVTASAATTAAGRIPKVEIAPGLSVSRVIKGCWQLSGGHRGDPATDRTAGPAAVEDFETFVSNGVTSLDVADHYGPGETLIGRYLRVHPERRADVQVLTKLCVFSSLDMVSLNKDYIDQCVATSRARLGVKPDLMQLYWNEYSLPKYIDATKYLGDAQTAGQIGHVGATNFDMPRVQAMVDTGVKIASHQVQYSLLDTRPQNGMAELCASSGISLLPYGVLAGGLLSSKYLGVPASQVRLDTSSKGKYAAVIQQRGGWTWFQELLAVLDTVGQRHNTSISNIAAKWVLDQPQVGGVILGARNANHIQDHVELFKFDLDDTDRAQINEVLAKGKKPKGDCYAWERGMGSF